MELGGPRKHRIGHSSPRQEAVTANGQKKKNTHRTHNTKYWAESQAPQKCKPKHQKNTKNTKNTKRGAPLCRTVSTGSR